MGVDAIREFWSWFEDYADELESVLANTTRMSASLADTITSYVHAIHPKMNWEIGPESTPDGCFFAFSPSGSPELLAISRMAVTSAPTIQRWTFRPAKPPKDWSARVVVLRLDGVRRRVCFDAWHFVVRTRSEAVIEVVLYGDGISDLSQGLRQTLGWILLDSELGEELTSTHRIVMDVEPYREGLAARPIGELRALFDASSPSGA